MADPPRADYLRHERVYAARIEATGWNTPAEDLEIRGYVDELLDAASVRPGAAVLEVGCGMGNLSLGLAASGLEVTGIDISPTAVHRARARAEIRGIAATFVLGDVLALEDHFRAGRFDCVVDGLCWHCIIGVDRGRFLDQVARVLRPEGRLLVVTMCGEPRSPVMSRFFDPVTRCVGDVDAADRYLGRPEDLLRELRDHRFVVEYGRTEPGRDGPSDQDMLLAVAALAAPREDRKPVQVGRASET